MARASPEMRGRDSHSSGTDGCPSPQRNQPGQPGLETGLGSGISPEPVLSLFGLAPGGVYRAAAVTSRRGGLLPHPFTLTPANRGGLLSVALSLRLPSPGVTRHRVSMEPGLSSPAAFRHLRQRLPGRLALRDLSCFQIRVKRAEHWPCPYLHAVPSRAFRLDPSLEPGFA